MSQKKEVVILSFLPGIEKNNKISISLPVPLFFSPSFVLENDKVYSRRT